MHKQQYAARQHVPRNARSLGSRADLLFCLVLRAPPFHEVEVQNEDYPRLVRGCDLASLGLQCLHRVVDELQRERRKLRQSSLSNLADTILLSLFALLSKRDNLRGLAREALLSLGVLLLGRGESCFPRGDGCLPPLLPHPNGC